MLLIWIFLSILKGFIKKSKELIKIAEIDFMGAAKKMQKIYTIVNEL
jgi:hypothetical protein